MVSISVRVCIVPVAVAIALALLSLTTLVIGETVSFTANGEWLPAEDSEEVCRKRYMCTPSGLTWKPNYPSKLFTNETACEALINKGITKIFFHGDSFMRQIYAAMLITLNGDYRYGSQANAASSPDCEYHKQFNEKRCGTRQLNHYGKVCGEKIILDPLLNGVDNFGHCQKENGTVLLWSFGNYKLHRYGRLGVNNATEYQMFFEKNVCKINKESQEKFTGIVGKPCSLWWVSTHYRLKAHYPDEVPEQVRDYNYGMREYFDNVEKPCGNVNYVDVYNMTAALALNHNSEAQQMTYDQVHWGYEANLVKAQIILNALISSPNKN